MTNVYHEVSLSGNYPENLSAPYPADRGYTKKKKI